MNILVTGAGGFLGRYIAEKLVKDGHSVFNFSRSSYSELESIGINNISGDLKNLSDVENAFENMDAVFHVASKVGMWGRWQDFYDANIVGTENVIKACRQHKIKKLVYTSTPSVVFGADDLENADETTPYPEEYLTHYAKSKAIAEKMVMDANNKEGLLTVSIRPHLIFGKRDPNLIPRVIEAAKAKKLRIVGDGDNLVDIIHVENAADAHIQAFNKLEPGSAVCGKTYFIGQERPVNLWDFINTILEKHQVPAITKKISLKKAFFIGGVIELALKTLRIHNVHPPMSRFIALQLAKSHYFNHAKAKEELGFSPKITINEALTRL